MVDENFAADLRVTGVELNAMPLFEIYWIFYRHFTRHTSKLEIIEMINTGLDTGVWEQDAPKQSAKDAASVLGYSINGLKKMVNSARRE